MHVDVTDLLHDKSIIPARSQWIYKDDKEVHRTLYGRFPSGPALTSKSPIVSFLETEEVDVEDIINLIENGIIPDEWRVILAVAKEREQKRDNAWFYVKMIPEMQLYQTAT
ncbi:unnamed protein product [Diabrotica balteata]|uniref:Uncharacterized protein n=1 Tax=Diabrotica balteata TaxID=107213 RepID=A0A9N9XKX7_DIABA|nr:unnamed protein product [Diabrotica balteata]